jgi:retron-type reverse transcriptase
MRRAALARNLAVTLANAPWTARDAEAALARRLPPALVGEAAGLAAHVLAASRTPYAPSAEALARSLADAPGLARVHAHCARAGVWPDPDLAPPRMRPIAPFATLDLPALATPAALADWLLLTPERLDYFADLSGRVEEAGETAINHYFHHLHPKKSGGKRLIEAPKPALKSLQRRVLDGVLAHVPPHPDAFGFVPSRNCLMAAQRHAAEEVVISLDLKDYFPSVAAGRIHALFRCLGYPHPVARLLTGLTTIRTPARVLERMPPAMRQAFRDPHLPQGAPTSPALANLASFALDRRLAGLAHRLGAAYSRYADDLTFSGDRRIARAVLAAVPGIVAEEGFVLNQSKTRVMPAATRQRVTGVVVNRHLNIARPEFDRLKAILHRCAQPGDGRLADPIFRARLEGKVGWAEAVNPARGAKLRALLDAALG